MSVIVVRFASLQPLAAACLRLAAKVSHGEKAHTSSLKGIPLDVRFELPILQALRWRLIVPTAYSFLPLLAQQFCIPADAVGLAAPHAELLITRKKRIASNPSARRAKGKFDNSHSEHFCLFFLLQLKSMHLFDIHPVFWLVPHYCRLASVAKAKSCCLILYMMTSCPLYLQHWPFCNDSIGANLQRFLTPSSESNLQDGNHRNQ